jgi:hypothetical protein
MKTEPSSGQEPKTLPFFLGHALTNWLLGYIPSGYNITNEL